MKPVKAWAVVTKAGKLVVDDARVAVFWRQGPAKREIYLDDRDLVRVEIRELPRKKAK